MKKDTRDVASFQHPLTTSHLLLQWTFMCRIRSGLLFNVQPPVVFSHLQFNFILFQIAVIKLKKRPKSLAFHM